MHRAVSLVLIPLALALACGDASAPPTAAELPPPTPTPAPQLTHGVDVSWHNGGVDWAAVREAGFTFGIVKASEGVDAPDPTYDQHWEGLTSAGLVRGAYHFYVTEDDPDAQADLFLATARLEPGDLAPVVDVELIGRGTAPGLADRLQRFLDRLEEHHGVPPILYTSPDFADEHLGPAFARYPLWIAEYGVDAPRVPDGWATWHLWQHTDDARVPGVATTADVTRSNPQLGPGDAVLFIPERTAAGP